MSAIGDFEPEVIILGTPRRWLRMRTSGGRSLILLLLLLRFALARRQRTFTHQRPQREHVRHELSHLADGRERDGIPVHELGHPYGVHVQPRERTVHHEPDDGRGRLPGAAADRHLRERHVESK